MVKHNSQSFREGVSRRAEADGAKPDFRPSPGGSLASGIGDVATPHPRPKIMDLMKSYRGWWNLPISKK